MRINQPTQARSRRHRARSDRSRDRRHLRSRIQLGAGRHTARLRRARAHRPDALDLGKHGFSPLDRQTITSDILDLHGKIVGRLDDDCAITAVGNRAGAICSYALTLAGGQLVGTRFDAFAAGETGQPITGGSSTYRNAHGQVRPLRKTERGLEFAVELTPREPEGEAHSPSLVQDQGAFLPRIESFTLRTPPADEQAARSHQGRTAMQDATTGGDQRRAEPGTTTRNPA